MAHALAAAAVADDAAVANYFEVHVRRGDRWVIDCTAASAADALADAEDIARKAEVLGVKVINERYNPRTDQSATRVIFKREKPERKRPGGFVRVMAAPPAAAPAPQPAPLPTPGAAAAPSHDAGLTLPPRAKAESSAAPAPWLLFAWSSLALAVTATLLFVLLLAIA